MGVFQKGGIVSRERERDGNKKIIRDNSIHPSIHPSLP
jgi:hypothetical protein